MTEPELDRVIAALVAGKRFDILGADGEWGIDHENGRFRVWMHEPNVDVADRFVGEADIRAELAPLDYATVLARLR